VRDGNLRRELRDRRPAERRRPHAAVKADQVASLSGAVRKVAPATPTVVTPTVIMIMYAN
jgi:hypothetical protein